MVLPLRSSNFFTSSWAMSTCGSFWNTAATLTTGTPPSRIWIICRSLDPITHSAWPAAIICSMLTCGPPILMVTSSPYFLYRPVATAW